GWLALFPDARRDAEAERLCEELMRAASVNKPAVLSRLKEGKGDANTLALAKAIPQLLGSAREPARDTLARRLSKAHGDELRRRLLDLDDEIRAAAARGCGLKKDPAYLADLEDLLDDEDEAVAKAAAAATEELRKLAAAEERPEK